MTSPSLSIHRETEVPAHFATPGTFEYEWSQRWRSLEEVEQSRRDALDLQFKEAREKLEDEMRLAIQDHEAMLVRQGNITYIPHSSIHKKTWNF